MLTPQPNPAHFRSARKGSANTQRGTKRFVQETVARCRRVNLARPLTMRFDSGFWNKDTMAELGRLDVRFTMAVKTGNTAIAAAIATIEDNAWVPIALPLTSRDRIRGVSDRI